MAATRTADDQQTSAYYDGFALVVGLRDYLMPNPRHRAIAKLLRRRLGRGLSILDVGCGAGQLTRYLARHGKVLGCDISGPAIQFAQISVPNAQFAAGRVEDITGTFDVVTCLDVFEHIPRGERAAFLAALVARLNSDGRIILTTPHPAFTHELQDQEPDRLQVVDEVVLLAEVLAEIDALGLECVHYEAYDLGKVGIYQYIEITRAREAGYNHSHPWSRPVRAARLAAHLVHRLVDLPGLLKRLRGYWQ